MTELKDALRRAAGVREGEAPDHGEIKMRAHQILRRRRIAYSALSVVAVAAIGFAAFQVTNDDAPGDTAPVGTPDNSTTEPGAVLHVVPENPVDGDRIGVTVESTGTKAVSYGAEYVLEHRVDGGWEELSQAGTWPTLIYEALPGERGPVQTHRPPLAAGTYRVTKLVRMFDADSASYIDNVRISRVFTVAAGEPTPPPPIEVSAPMPGDRVESPILVSGTADVYEATVSIRIRDSHGEIIAETFTTATCGSGCRGDYSKGVKYEVEDAQGGTVEVYSVSAENGKPMHLVEIPVVLNP